MGKNTQDAGNKEDEGYAHMVSACLSNEGVSLGQLTGDKKPNEHTVIPRLSDILGIKECTVTADAVECRKKIIRKRVKKVSYVLAEKERQ